MFEGLASFQIIFIRKNFFLTAISRKGPYLEMPGAATLSSLVLASPRLKPLSDFQTQLAGVRKKRGLLVPRSFAYRERNGEGSQRPPEAMVPASLLRAEGTNYHRKNGCRVGCATWWPCPPPLLSWPVIGGGVQSFSAVCMHCHSPPVLAHSEQLL